MLRRQQQVVVIAKRFGVCVLSLRPPFHFKILGEQLKCVSQWSFNPNKDGDLAEFCGCWVTNALRWLCGLYLELGEVKIFNPVLTVSGFILP